LLDLRNKVQKLKRDIDDEKQKKLQCANHVSDMAAGEIGAATGEREAIGCKGCSLANVAIVVCKKDFLDTDG
jgi:hypothetical protein